MSRIKPYYNDSELVTDLYTIGKEWQLQDGTEYIGLYHKYISTGEVYTNPTWNISVSKQLVKYQSTVNKNTVPYKKLKPNLNVNYIVPTEIYPEPTTEDIVRTYFIRYFIKKQNESEIIEIDKTQYDLWLDKKIDPIMYTAIALKWYIVGPADTEINGVIKIEGVNDKNKKTIQIANRTIPGIITIFNNKYNQFYTDTDYIIPPDINSDTTDTTENTDTNENTDTEQNKTIIDETGKLATDDIAEQIKRTIFIDVDTKRIEFNSQQQVLQPIDIQPITKYIKNGITTIHPFYNINVYSYKLSNSKVGIITSDTPTLNQQDGSSTTLGKKLVFTPNSEEISNRSNEQATIDVYPTDITDLIKPITITLFFNIGN